MAHLAAALAFPLGGGAASRAVANDALRDALGQDVYFTNTFPLADNGDFMILEGLAAVRQAIRVRLLTRPGELPWAPTFGVGVMDYLGKLNTTSAREELKRRIRENLLSDSRISAIVSADVEEKEVGTTMALVVQVGVKVVTGAEDKSVHQFYPNGAA